MGNIKAIRTGVYDSNGGGTGEYHKVQQAHVAYRWLTSGSNVICSPVSTTGAFPGRVGR